MTPTAVDLIERKRDSKRLSSDEIHWLIASFTNGEVTDYQMAAMAMAVFINGLDPDELSAWTGAMLHSGEVLDLSAISLPKIDKHSTGGVGDKVSIPLVPLVAACGVAVPMISGRGLGHSGGTLDKLESIPGFTTALDPKQFREVLEGCGLVLAGQSETLVPADRKLYALRDATGTVPSIPLIASSIMSKKLAEDLDGLVLDVKVGRGAFMTELPKARKLAETMVGIGRSYDLSVTALLTAMDQPLGREVGNASEIRESIAVLKGEGPGDLTELVMVLGEEMLTLAGIGSGRERLERALTSGAALERLSQVIEAQGGDQRVIEHPELLPVAAARLDYPALTGGTITRCDAKLIGIAAMRMGAGRERKEDGVDPAVGITVQAKIGDQVEAGQPLATLAYNDPSRLSAALGLLEGAWELGEGTQVPGLVLDRIGGR
jgi:pyrimidine-nucleoside phosphorylase